MAKGSRGGRRGGGKLAAEEKRKITNGIMTHSQSANDRAEEYLTQMLQKEKDVLSKKAAYIATGYIKSENDEWWQGHVKSEAALNAKLEFFKKERKRLGK